MTDPFSYPWILSNYFRDEKQHYRLVPQIKQAGSSMQTEPRMMPVSRAATWEVSLTIVLVQDEKQKWIPPSFLPLGWAILNIHRGYLFPTREWAGACYDRKDMTLRNCLHFFLPECLWSGVFCWMEDKKEIRVWLLRISDRIQLKSSSSSPWARNTWTCFQGSQSQV